MSLSTHLQHQPGAIAPEIRAQIEQLQQRVESLSGDLAALASSAGVAPEPITRASIVQGYVGVLVVSFLVTLLATPLMRHLAVRHGIVDRPSDPRKVHRIPTAYLGGAAVFLGLLGGILFSFLGLRFPDLVQYHAQGDSLLTRLPVPPAFLVGMTVIVVVGLLDDVLGISPRVKIGGQLIAAAGLAIDNVGSRVAAGALLPLAKSLGVGTIQMNGVETLGVIIPVPLEAIGITAIPIDFIYWVGTALIAVAVLGMCNATNLIDGLDGLLSGTTAISCVGLLFVALSLAMLNDGPRDVERVILCLALLGACLGFLPHNFNPATIFLGDAGSLLIGFTSCVIILTLGDTGKTHLVAAGCIIFAVPIIDTSLAIVRRKLEGKSISAADSNHLHHMLKRALGVKGAVIVLYGMAASFAVLGVAISLGRARMIYVLTLILAAFIGVTAFLAETPELPLTLGEVLRMFSRRDLQGYLTGMIEARRLAGTPHSSACINALNDYLAGSADTVSGVRKSVTTKLVLWFNPRIDAATAESDFDLRLLRRNLHAIYVGVTPTTSTGCGRCSRCSSSRSWT